MQEFSATVFGPYSPVQFVDEGDWITPLRTRTVDANYVVDLVEFFKSVLLFRGHGEYMAKSDNYSKVMMGEIDDAELVTTVDAYLPIKSAGFFGIMVSVSLLSSRHDRKAKIPDGIMQSAAGVAVLLLHALATDDEAIACYVRYSRTGCIGTPSVNDISRVDEIKKFFRSIANLGSVFEDNMLGKRYDIPLQKYRYEMQSKDFRWSNPISVPEIPRDEEEDDEL